MKVPLLIYFLTFIFLTIISCKGHPDCPNGYAISNKFSHAERRIIINSGREWNDFAGDEVIKFNGSVESTGCGINRLSSKEEYEALRDNEDVERHFAGVVIYKTGTVWINASVERSPEQFRIIALHELGHAIGLWKHVKSGVMQPSIYDGKNFTIDDYSECVSVGVCSLTRGNFNADDDSQFRPVSGEDNR